MNRWLFVASWICLSGLFLQMMRPSTNVRVDSIVIDPGHGGKDPGARSKYGVEKVYVLGMALRLGKKIKKEFPEVKVLYTRDSDVFIPLHERAALANRNKASLFISIHCNANPHSNKLRGTESYVMGLHKSNDNLELAKRENNVVLLEENYKKTYKGFDPNSPLAHIMLSNYQSSFRQQSLQIASLIEQKSIASAKNRPNIVQTPHIVEHHHYGYFIFCFEFVWRETIHFGYFCFYHQIIYNLIIYQLLFNKRKTNSTLHTLK